MDMMEGLEEINTRLTDMSKGMDELVKMNTDLRLFLISINQYEAFEKWREGKDV